jgi:hypothetical protein
MGGFHRGNVGGHVHNHQARGIAFFVGANGAFAAFAKGVALAAVGYLAQGGFQRAKQFGCAIAVLLQQGVRHALRGFRAHIWEYAQGLDKGGVCVLRFGHGFQAAFVGGWGGKDEAA